MMLFGIAMGVTAQVTASELKIKASKDAKKEAKRLSKEGWTPFPGGLPIERQYDKVFLLEYDEDINMEPKWAFGEGRDQGQFFEAARSTADAFAKSNLVGKLNTEITTEVKAQMSNKELQDAQAQSVAAVVEKSASITVQRLSGIKPVLQLQRKLKNGNVEVMVRYAYNREKAKMDTFKWIDDECKAQGINLGLVE